MRKSVYAICEQQRRRSAFTSALSGQHLCCSLLRSYYIYSCYIQCFKSLASFCGCAGRFESYQVANPKGRFSRNEAHFICICGFSYEVLLVESCLVPCSRVCFSPVEHCDHLTWGRDSWGVRFSCLFQSC